jgi:choline dehydrogenase-like flavoprotein
MKIAVIGSGASGVSAAKCLISCGYEVDMIDFGNKPDYCSEQLAERIRTNTMSDNDHFKLKNKIESVNFLYNIKNTFNSLTGRKIILDWDKKKRLGSDFTFRDTKEWIPVEGPPVARTLACGGLTNIWGASCYPLTEEDFTKWPINKNDMESHYTAVAKMLSIRQAKDHLSDIFPIYGGDTELPKQSEVSNNVFKHWNNNSTILMSQGIIFGRSRLAMRIRDSENGLGCVRCGMCLTGCAYDSIYRSSWTLNELLKNNKFSYFSPFWFQKFEEQGDSVIIHLINKKTRIKECLTYDALFLATGTISTFRIVADSQKLYNVSVELCDNDHYLLPFIRRSRSNDMMTKPEMTLNELVLRFEILGSPLHLQLYPMSPQIYDRFQEILNINSKFTEKISENVLSKILLSFVYLPGEVSAKMKIEARKTNSVTNIIIKQNHHPKSKSIMRRAIWNLFRNRVALGMTPLPFVFPSTPKGPSGAHLSGSLPMCKNPGQLQTDIFGRIHGTSKVFAVDGSVLPSLPAQNSTYTMMANAHRIATAFASRN